MVTLKDLRRLGISPVVLEEIARLALHNPHQTCLTEEDTDRLPISAVLIQRSKQPKKLFNAFIRLRIYNFLYVKLDPLLYTFVVKEALGRLIKIDIPKTSVPNYKYAVMEALVQANYEIALLPTNVQAEPHAVERVDTAADYPYAATDQMVELDYESIGTPEQPHTALSEASSAVPEPNLSNPTSMSSEGV